MRTATAIACTLALLAVPFVGCIGSSDEGGQEVEPDEQSGAEDEAEQTRQAPAGDEAQAVASNRIETFATNGSFTAETYRIGLPGTVSGDKPSLTFEAPSDAVQILVEFRWSAAAASFDLDLFSPAFCEDEVTDVDPIVDDFVCAMEFYATEDDGGVYQTEGSPVPAGEGQLRLVVDAEEIAEASCEESSCEWRAYAFAEAAVDVTFEMHVTVAHDAPLPDDYTGLEG